MKDVCSIEEAYDTYKNFLKNNPDIKPKSFNDYLDECPELRTKVTYEEAISMGLISEEIS